VLTLAIEISNPSSWTRGCAWSQGVALGRVHRRDRADVPAGQGGPAELVRDDVLVELLGVEAIDAGARHDDEVMPAIARLCERAGVAPAQLERVAVSAGPGGFTGLRIAVTTAKFIAEGVGAGCVGVPSAAVAARRVGAAGRVAIAVASKGESAFVSVFESGRMVEEGRPMTAAELPGLACATLVGDRFLPEAMRAWAMGAGVAVVEPTFDPVACLEASAGWPVVDAGALTPIYAREPEAVTKWRQLHPR
jgi:tRNA threonylcarbamoyl adenosine modification protein YeaZ